MNGRREALGRRALEIISVLADARGEVVSKDKLLELVWPGIVVEENALQVHVVALRKALGPEADRLQTIRGVGYRLEFDEVLEESPKAEASTPAASSSPMGPMVARLTRLWPKSRAPGLALALAGLLLVLAGIWGTLGSQLGLRPQERIPVVVHALAASANGDPAEAGLASGITDELILRLRRVPELRIATAAPDGTVPGNEFDGAYVVDGTIRSSRERLRVTARLIDAGGEILWSETFDRALVDLLDVQEEIAKAVGDALSVSLDVGINSRDYGGTDNPEAFAHYVQGRSQRFNADRTIPIGHVERAVELDPGYVKALFELTIAYGLALYEVSDEAEAQELLAKMDAVSARALAAKPNLWLGQAARGWFELANMDFAQADARLQRVQELDEGIDPELRNVLALFAQQLGRVRFGKEMMDSKALIDPAFRRDPEGITAAFMNLEFDEAIARYDDFVASDPSMPVPAGTATSVYWAHLLSGNDERAREVATRSRLDPYYLQVSQFRFDPVDFPDLPEAELRQWADGKFGATGRVQLSSMALFASHFGHQDTAFRYLRLAYERPGIGGYYVIWHPALTDLRKTAAFERWIDEIGMVDAWRESGDWGDFCRPVSASEITCR